MGPRSKGLIQLFKIQLFNYSKSMKRIYTILGLMSGSSLDGLDIACCRFGLKRGEKEEVEIEWELVKAVTVPFSDKWVARLANLPTQSALAFAKTHTYFGHYMAELVNAFLEKHDITPDYIASHGHTIFHHPDKLMTTQIGDGGALAANTGYTVICDFRTQDIALNGEGTPIAPAADLYLFSDYDFLLNIGGIANITLNDAAGPIAFDIAPANQVLNMLAQQKGMPYDHNGELAASGQLNDSLLSTVNQNDYYQQSWPKSLDNQWIHQNVFPVYQNHDAALEDKLHTACHHLAEQTAKAIDQLIAQKKLNKSSYQLLATGGGALNAFLMDCIRQHCNEKHSIEVVVPSIDIVLYKEAILMGLMGLLRVEGIVNCFSSVTGAKMDTVGGAVYRGWR